MRGQSQILYCVLNWGLGHATRSIPVICALREKGFIVDIASDGGPLKLLQKTFPDARTYSLPGYDVHYPSRSFLINAISQIRNVLRGEMAEHKWVEHHLSSGEYHAIVSDNRYGCHHESVPSILITHVVRNMTSSTLLNIPAVGVVNQFLKPFDEIWIPDAPDRALSGKMSNIKSDKVRFIGHLSDQKFHSLEKRYEVAAVLSGPEPQRSKLEEEILPQLRSYPGKCVLVRGVIEDISPVVEGHLTIYQYLDRQAVNNLLNSTDVIVCRTGYSSLMDLMQVRAKAVLIPTPGQPEQEYLGVQMDRLPQFITQHQGKIDLEPAIKTLLKASVPPSATSTDTLLDDAIDELSGLISMSNGSRRAG